MHRAATPHPGATRCRASQAALPAEAAFGDFGRQSPHLRSAKPPPLMQLLGYCIIAPQAHS